MFNMLVALHVQRLSTCLYMSRDSLCKYEHDSFHSDYVVHSIWTHGKAHHMFLHVTRLTVYTRVTWLISLIWLLSFRVYVSQHSSHASTRDATHHFWMCGVTHGTQVTACDPSGGLVKRCAENAKKFGFEKVCASNSAPPVFSCVCRVCVCVVADP